MNSVRSLEELYPYLFDKQKKIVGWGTGSLYRHYRKLFPIALDYIVDNNAEKWGEQVDNYEVRSPQRLLEEDPNNLVIIIYSSFLYQIEEQIRSMGDFNVIHAGAIVGYQDFAFYMERLRWQMEHSSKTRNPSSQRAIVIQGPITKNLHVEIVQHYAQSNSSDTVILSTWEATNPVFLKKLEPWVDHLVLNSPPDYSGYQNRNYQIISTLEGLRKAHSIGAEFVIKTRVDIALLTDNLFKASKDILSLYNPKVAQSYGLKNRIIVPECYTRKFVPYHPSDLVMIGHTEDLLKYWDVPLDQRRFVLTDLEWKGKTLEQIGSEGGPAESYLATSFVKKLGRKLLGSVEDSWDVYRDFFLVTDCSWFELFFSKYPRISGRDIRNVTHECISHGFWQKLYFGSLNKSKAFQGVEPNNVIWDEFYNQAPLQKV